MTQQLEALAHRDDYQPDTDTELLHEIALSGVNPEAVLSSTALERGAVRSLWDAVVDHHVLFVPVRDKDNHLTVIFTGPDSPYSRLTQREILVVQALNRGLLNKEVGYEIGISINTVATHLRNIMLKFGVRNRTELKVLIARMQSWSSETIAERIKSFGYVALELKPTVTETEIHVRGLQLSQRIAFLVRDGRSNQEIANVCGLTLIAARNRVIRLCKQFGVNSRSELAQILTT